MRYHKTDPKRDHNFDNHPYELEFKADPSSEQNQEGCYYKVRLYEVACWFGGGHA